MGGDCKCTLCVEERKDGLSQLEQRRVLLEGESKATNSNPLTHGSSAGEIKKLLQRREKYVKKMEATYR